MRTLLMNRPRLKLTTAQVLHEENSQARVEPGGVIRMILGPKHAIVRAKAMSVCPDLLVEKMTVKCSLSSAFVTLLSEQIRGKWAACFLTLVF